MNELARALQTHDDVHWVAVDKADRNSLQKIGFGLVDPLQAHWDSALLPLVPDRTGSSGGGTSGNADDSTTSTEQIAWSDSRGLHVTDDLNVDVSWKPDDNGIPTNTSSASAAVYRHLMTEHQATRVDDIRGLTPYGEITYDAGRETINVLGVVSIVGFLIALGFLLSCRPRYRTRWSWFWIFACPMGIGFIWYLMREGWFAHTGAANGQRKSGWRGVGAFLLISTVTIPVVEAWMFS